MTTANNRSDNEVDISLVGHAKKIRLKFKEMKVIADQVQRAIMHRI